MVVAGAALLAWIWCTPRIWGKEEEEKWVGFRVCAVDDGNGILGSIVITGSELS